MRYRTLGKTGIQVSEIGFGAWGIGGELWQGADDKEALRTLARAADMGLNFIDTALAYGDGHSEQLVGAFLKESRERMVIATKIPPKNNQWPAKKGSRIGEVFPASHIVRSTEKSLKNLGIETIDIQQLHVWLDDWTDVPEWFDAISRLKADGKIRFFGVSINDHDPASALKITASGKVDTVQVIYNIFDQSPEEELFPLCLKRDIGVIARVPFDEGALTGAITPETTFPEKDFRSRYFRDDRKQQVHHRVGALTALLGSEARTLPELALRFCLHHTAVSTVIPGMRTVKHVECNCPLSDGRALSTDILEKLREHRWEKNFY
jgi:aryl-alcohol dehydrogenase-like predicted oxidoreductase